MIRRSISAPSDTPIIRDSTARHGHPKLWAPGSPGHVEFSAPPVIRRLDARTGDPDDGGELTARTGDPDDGGQLTARTGDPDDGGQLTARTGDPDDGGQIS